MAKRSVGDTPLNSLHDGWDSEKGITYRQWLIGQALSGTSASGVKIHDIDLSERCISIADAIIDRLDAEQQMKDEANNGEAK